VEGRLTYRAHLSTWTHSHTLTNLQQFYFLLEMMKRVNDCCMQQFTALWWAG